MKIFCPNCKTQITGNNINVSENICVCSVCNEIFKLSEVFDQDKYSDAENLLKSPPEGIDVKNDNDNITINIYTSPDNKNKIFLFFFALGFSSISFFGFYQMISERVIIGILFMLMFVVASLYLWHEFFYAVFGKIMLSVNSEYSSIFIGIGSIGREYLVNWEQIENIYAQTDFLSEGNVSKKIHIAEKSKTIKVSVKYIDDEKIRMFLLLMEYFRRKRGMR